MRWLRDLTWKQRYAEKSALCDDIEKELSRFNRRRRELERDERLARIAERVHLQRKAKGEETGGPMVQCARCNELAFGGPADLCALCELDECLAPTKNKAA